MSAICEDQDKLKNSQSVNQSFFGMLIIQVTMACQQAPRRAHPARPRLLLLGHSHVKWLTAYIRSDPARMQMNFGLNVWVDHQGTGGLTIPRARQNFIHHYGNPRRPRPNIVMLFIGDNNDFPRSGHPRNPSYIVTD